MAEESAGSKESAGSIDDDTLSIQDVDELPEEEQIHALQTIVKRLESDVAGAQVAYQQLTADQKKYKKEIVNLEMEITAEQVRVTRKSHGCFFFFFFKGAMEACGAASECFCFHDLRHHFSPLAA